MKVSKARMTAQLRRDEGTVPYAFRDSEGYWTIGTGRLIDRRKGGGLSTDEIDYLLSNDIDKHYDELVAALPWAEHLDEARLAALLNMAFQMGVPNLLGFKQTLAAVRDGRYDHAEQLALQSLWAKQTPERARRVARQLASGEWQ